MMGIFCEGDTHYWDGNDEFVLKYWNEIKEKGAFDESEIDYKGNLFLVKIIDKIEYKGELICH